jgi:hypothetical protein
VKDSAFQKALQTFNNQNYETARILLIPLANLDHAEAQCLLGNIYFDNCAATHDQSLTAEANARAQRLAF